MGVNFKGVNFKATHSVGSGSQFRIYTVNMTGFDVEDPIQALKNNILAAFSSLADRVMTIKKDFLDLKETRIAESRLFRYAL